jgi:uncharacterized protein
MPNPKVQKMSIAVLLVGLFLVSAPMSFGQKGSQTGRSPSSTMSGMPDADSLKKYGDLLDKGDSLTLARVAAAGKGLQLPPRTAQLYLLARAKGDSIVLRWAPSTSGGWLAGNRAGYVVSRGLLKRDGSIDKSTIAVLTTSPLMPWSNVEFGQRADHGNRWAAVASGSLHAKSFVPEMQQRSETGQIKAATDDLLARYAYAMLAADNDPVAANGLALRFVDRNVAAGERYVYSVRPATKDTSYAVLEGVTTASPGAALPDPPPPGLEAESLDRLVILRWLDGVPGARYGGFYISRSDDGGKTYSRLHQNLFIPGGEAVDDPHIAFPDSAVVNYRRYIYRVQGVTPFGELSESAEVEAMPHDVTPPSPPIAERPVDLGRKGTRISWDMPAASEDLHGFVVLRSAFWQTGYHPAQEPVTTKVSDNDPAVLARAIQRNILAPTARAFTDSLGTPAEPYYIVASIDTAGNLGRSLPVYSERIDTMPPGIPVGIRGTIDSLGVVRLHWHLGPEPNLLGYRVYWSNSATDTFAVRVAAPIADTTFTDTVEVNTLTRHVYYRITAVNNRYIPSPFSPIIALTRPDIIPPAAPQFVSVIVSDSAVVLKWAPSPSADVRSHHLLRRRYSDSSWASLKSLGRLDSAYADKSVMANTIYEYVVEAIDSSGLHSPQSVSVVARPYDTGVRPPVADLRAVYNPEKKFVDLKWSYASSKKEHFWFVLYRDVAGKGLESFKALDGSARSFEDDANLGKGVHRYAIKVRTDVGGEPPLSDPVEVDVR